MNHNHLAALRFSVIAMSIHADAADIKSKWTMMNLKRLWYGPCIRPQGCQPCPCCPRH